MPEADVVYCDVRFTASKERSKETSSSQPETTYAEVKTGSEAPSSPAEATYAEVKKRAQRSVSQSEAADGRSKVTERTLLLVLCALLTAAAVGLCVVSVDHLKTKRKLDEIEAKVKGLENSTGFNSSSLVKPTCLNDSKLQTCMNDNEALRKNLTEILSEITSCSTARPTSPKPTDATTTEPCPSCETGWDQHGGRCYYFSSSKQTWNQSRGDCKGQRADLVQIDSEEEQWFLEYRVRRKMISGDDLFWIGLTDAQVEGRWLWVDGSLLNTSLSFWFGAEPDNWKVENPAGENCARMGNEEGAAALKCWFDKSCDSAQRCICEKAAETKP